MVLPYIEMYGGNSDVWEIPVYGSDNTRLPYADATLCTFKLTIKDYGYSHRPNGTCDVSIVKTGELLNEDGNALIMFQFAPSDTMEVSGKFIYQISAEGPAVSDRNVAQGELCIVRAIDQ